MLEVLIHGPRVTRADINNTLARAFGVVEIVCENGGRVTFFVNTPENAREIAQAFSDVADRLAEAQMRDLLEAHA